MKCNRTACPNELVKYVIAIWNQGTPIPRIYCVKCGRTIIDYNQQDDMKLLWEMVTVADAEHTFPSLFKENGNA